MSPLVWLVIAIVAAAGAYLIGWPAWRSYRSRESRDLNTERYLQWRGRASRPSSGSTREGMTGEERRRVYVAAALAALAIVALIAFFATS
ncbi:MAG TPA: hypothetical protein VFV59_02395 [Candidatus Limnocylindria bacterium]|nr:hypothetical protein [Candidatus Limnocylindria bacterium]